ncbi:MAG: CDP-alcohol phosphatidyltransferase family protein [Rhodoluna sp.]|nr:CDP-alcohol phosphatidyltransferase family protein [Rhodoluna sp.]
MQKSTSSRPEWFNLPNSLSFLRILLVPVFLWLIVANHTFWAIGVLAFSSITDYLDGYLARRWNQQTRLGQLLDPAADRLYIFATLLGLTLVGYVPAWLFWVILARELVLIPTMPMLSAKGYGPLPVHFLGKAGTFCLLYAFPLLLIAKVFTDISSVVLPLAWGFAIWGIGLYWWSAVLYYRQVFSVIKATPKNH